jgi:membrane fusion protein (multidrug efflux system)
LQKEAISQEEYDVARAEYASMKAQSQLIKAQIAKTAVRAPFSGRIGTFHFCRNLHYSCYFELVNIGKLKITFQFLKNMQIR